MRFLFVLFALILNFSFALAQQKQSQQDRIEGTFTVAFGSYRGADGQMHSMKGLKLPFVAERMDPAKLVRFRTPHKAKPPVEKPTDLKSFVDFLIDPRWQANTVPLGEAALFDTTAYMADAGNGTYGAFDPAGEFSDPTSLDDHVMSAGAGRLWQNFQFGVNITESRTFVCRWIIYNNFTQGLGHDVSAFSSVISDFGVILSTNPPFHTNPYAVGAWVFTIDISPQPAVGWPGVVCPDNSIYMAQQFRQRQNPEMGEGPFDQAQFNLYNIAAGPTVGTSENNFWYDWDPQNGVYAEDELEILDPTQAPFSNLLRTITVRGTVETVNPAVHEVFGADISGGIFELLGSDDTYVSFRARYDVARNDPNAMVTVEGVAADSNVTSIQFLCEAAAGLPGGTQDIQLWNYSTSAWDTVDSRSISNTDTVAGVFLTTNLSQYISGARHLRARVRFFPPADIDRLYRMRVDRMVWVLTHP